MSRLAITGASGFVARHLTALASAQGVEVVGAVRSEAGAETVRLAGGRPVLVRVLEPEPLMLAFAGASAVVHLAQIGAQRGGATYEAVNVAGTRAVALAAATARVARVVLLSGLGVARFGQSRRCTNAYFLSKLAAEVELYRAGPEVVVFRPSYVVGPGDAFVPALLSEIDAGEVEIVGEGSYRMQPVGVKDAAAAILEAALGPAHGRHRVYDLVGPEPITHRALVDRLAALLRARGRRAVLRIREVPVEEAEARAAAEGYRGMGPEELDCLLCDEVADPRPLEGLLGRFLTPLDQALELAVRSALPAGRDPQ